MLTFQSAGESHGKALVGIVSGMPSGVPISGEAINEELTRRQQGYGRGGRMKIEQDTAEILSGVRNGYTLGSPIALIITNQDHLNWHGIMDAGPCSHADQRAVYRPRPGHADLAGAIKYDHKDMRNILERSSARETAARVAAGSICKQFLAALDIVIYSQVVAIGSIRCQPVRVERETIKCLNMALEKSRVHCANEEASQAMMAAIDRAKQTGESLGGCFEVGAIGVLPGIGSHTSWNTKLDGGLAGALMSIPAIKGVEIGEGVANSERVGSEVHDEIFYDEDQGLYRKTNRAGGIEGGISNGENVWARAYMKPIPTLYRPLTSVNTRDWKEEKADIERSDICAVPSAAIVGEAMLALVLAAAVLEKFGGDSLQQVKDAYGSYRNYMKKVWKWGKTLF